MRNLKLTLAYDGTGYHGWQEQRAADGPTVQGILQQKFLQLTGESCKIVASGRTDAGVHAWGQVASVTTSSSIPAERFPQALNGFLPRDIVIREAEEVPPGFHACASAVQKTYRYTFYNRRYLSPFWRLYAYHFAGQLDGEAMQAGANLLVGEHDFSSFCSPQKTSAKNLCRTIYDCSVYREDGLIRIEVTADGFLYKMVRIIAGTLMQVGRRKYSPEKIKTIIHTRDRNAAGPTAPAHGLCLLHVKY